MNATQMEEFLRDALQARAAEVAHVEPRPATDDVGAGRPRNPRVRPWLIPLAAAAAVVALLGAVLVSRTALTGDDEDGPGPAASAGQMRVDPPPSFLGLRDGSLVRYATATGEGTIVVAVNPGTTVSSAAIAGDGTVYYTIVVINDSTSGQLWRIPPGAQPQLLLDPAEWAPRSVSEYDGVLAVQAGSRSSATGSYLDDSLVLLSAGDGAELRRVADTAIEGDDVQAIHYLTDGRLAVQTLSADRLSTTFVIDPMSATSLNDGPAIPVDPGWQVSAVASGPDGVVVAFWSGTAVEVNTVDATTFISTGTLYSSQDGQVVTALGIDPGSGAVLAARDHRASGGSPDAGSVPLVVHDGDATAVPGLEPPTIPPIDVVRIVGWDR